MTNSECFRGKFINLTEEKRELLVETGLREVRFSNPKSAAELREIQNNTLDELKKSRPTIPTDQPFQIGSCRLSNSCMPIQQFSSIKNSSVIRGVCLHVIVFRVFSITFVLDPNHDFGASRNKSVTKLSNFTEQS